jgi:hypothetical protein
LGNAADPDSVVIRAEIDGTVEMGVLVEFGVQGGGELLVTVLKNTSIGGLAGVNVGSRSPFLADNQDSDPTASSRQAASHVAKKIPRVRLIAGSPPRCGSLYPSTPPNQEMHTHYTRILGVWQWETSPPLALAKGHAAGMRSDSRGMYFIPRVRGVSPRKTLFPLSCR